MPTLELIFIVTISIMVLSVVLSIVDWIYLASLSTKTAFLERELEIRAQEFNSLKKEINNNRGPHTGGASVIEQVPQQPLAGSTPTLSVEDTIRIVRNVRGSFEQSESVTPPPSPSPDAPYSGPGDSSETVTQEPPSPTPSLPAEPVPTIDERYTAKPTAVSPGDESAENHVHAPPAPVGDGGIQSGTPAPPTPAAVVFRLYSDTSKDADFKLLQENISSFLKSGQRGEITIDFSNINFIYEKEMEYLEKMYYFIVNQGSTLSLINCDSELMAIFNNNTLLQTIVKPADL